MELQRPEPLRTVGELATERLIKIAKAAQTAEKLGTEGYEWFIGPPTSTNIAMLQIKLIFVVD